MSARAKKGAGKKGLGKRGKLALVVVGLLLVAALGYFVLVKPKKGEAAALDAKLADLQTQIVVRTSQSNTTGQPQADVDPSGLFGLGKAMPDRADMPGVLLELNDVAADTGIVFESIVPGPSTAKEGYQVLPINLVFQGDFYSLSDFLFRLRNLVRYDEGKLSASGRLFAVNTLTFTESTKKFPYLTASLSVNAFVYGTGAPASAGAGATPPATTDTTATTTAPATTTPAPETPAPAPESSPTAAPAAGGTS